MTISDFGEPWEILPCEVPYAIRAHGAFRRLTPEDYIHAVACVNAMAGMDPSKLSKFILVAKELGAYVWHNRDKLGETEIRRLARFDRALVGLEGKEETMIARITTELARGILAWDLEPVEPALGLLHDLARDLLEAREERRLDREAGNAMAYSIEQHLDGDHNDDDLSTALAAWRARKEAKP